MIAPENIPKSGMLIVTVNFKDYKDSHANDCRRILGGDKTRYEGLAVKAARRGLGVKLTPLSYWLGRTISHAITRGTAGSYRFGYSNMTEKDFKGLLEILDGMKLDWWEGSPEVLIADWVQEG
jgi:hypothetical protein